MPTEWVKRDVQLAVDQVHIAMKTVSDLIDLTIEREPGRALSIARTHLETANLYLRDVTGKTPESRG